MAVPAYTSGENWATQLKQNQVQLVKGKWYIAKYKVTSDVDKKIQLLVQNNKGWFVYAEQITAVAAGTTEEVEVVFQATETTNSVLFGFMMGFVDGTACDAANVTISDVSLTGYNADPREEVSTPEETTTVDETPVETTTIEGETPVETTTIEGETPVETTTIESETPVESTTTEDVTPVETTTIEDETPVETTTIDPIVSGGQNENTEAAGYAGLMNEAFLLGDVGANTYKATCGKGTINGIVNIQQPGAATEAGIYVSFKDASFGTMTVNGVPLDKHVEGAGVVMYLSNFKYMYSDVVFKNGDGTEKAVIYVYNAQGIDNSDKAIEIPTEPGDESQTSQILNLQQINQYSSYVNYGSYKLMITPGKQAYVGVDSINRDHIKVQNASGAGASSGSTQSKFDVARTFKGLMPGVKYVLSVDITADIAQGSYKTTKDATWTELKAGTTTVSMISTAYELNGVVQADFTLNLDKLGPDVKLDISNPQFREATEEDLTTTQAPTTTTQAPTATTQAPTVAPTTTTKQDATVAPTTSKQDVTVAPTTAKQDTTTVAPTKAGTDKVTKPAKAKIKKVNAKKKAAKKVKISLKKIKGAVGYQVAIYKTKKNAKNNKKALVKKIVTKRKVTITSKKLKNKKNLFVKARAYVLDGKTKVYGKWSNIKKVKIKK